MPTHTGRRARIRVPKTFLSPEEVALGEAIRRRLAAARGNPARLRLDGLPLLDGNDLGCDYRRHPGRPARRITTHRFDNVTAAGDPFSFEVHTLGRFRRNDGVVKLVEIVVMAGGSGYYPPHIHARSNAAFLFLAGRGAAWIARNEASPGAWRRYRSRSRLRIPAGTVHGFVTEGRSAFIVLQADRPIVCQTRGKADVDFITVADPAPVRPGTAEHGPRWVADLHARNRQAEIAPR